MIFWALHASSINSESTVRIHVPQGQSMMSHTVIRLPNTKCLQFQLASLPKNYFFSKYIYTAERERNEIYYVGFAYKIACWIFCTCSSARKINVQSDRRFLCNAHILNALPVWQYWTSDYAWPDGYAHSHAARLVLNRCPVPHIRQPSTNSVISHA